MVPKRDSIKYNLFRSCVKKSSLRKLSDFEKNNIKKYFIYYKYRMSKLFQQAIEVRTEYNVALFYLNITKKIIKCSLITEKRASLFIYDKDIRIYKRIEAPILGSIIRKELIKYLKKKISEKSRTNKLQEIVGLIDKLGSHNFMIKLVKTVAEEVYEKDFEDKLDSNKDVFNFRNGMVYLKTGNFRKRTPDDYVTKVLDYDYNPRCDINKMKEVARIYYHICNDDPKMLDSLLQFLGYCLTGHTIEQLMLFLIGEKASNGKTTSLAIFDICFPIYCKKINSKTFNEDYQKSHKVFAELNKLTRLIYIEELRNATLDVDLLKDFVDGKKIGSNEVLFGTVTDIIIQCKLISCSNKIPTFPPDNGVIRRCSLFNLTNKFVDKEEYDKLENKKGYYIKDKELLSLFEKDDSYKLAFFHILLSYAMKWYKTKLQLNPRFKEQWKEVCDENDRMKSFIEKKYIQTGLDQDRISKEEFTEAYNTYIGNKTNKLRWAFLLSDIKRLGIKYDRQKRAGGHQGCLIGLKEKAEEDLLGIQQTNDEDNNIKTDQVIETNEEVFINELIDKILNEKPKSEYVELIKMNNEFKIKHKKSIEEGLKQLKEWRKQFEPLRKNASKKNTSIITIQVIDKIMEDWE